MLATIEMKMKDQKMEKVPMMATLIFQKVYRNGASYYQLLADHFTINPAPSN